MKKIYSLLVAASIFTISAAASADPPAIVGRLSYIEGSASIRHADDGQWMVADVNYPIVAADAVWGADNSRAEIEVMGGEARIDHLSEIDIDQLDETGTALRLIQGVLNFTVRYVPQGGLQVATAVGRISILQPGEYHIDAGRPSGPPTQLLLGVLQGEAVFNAASGPIDLQGGRGVVIPPDQSGVSFIAIVATPFDRWAESFAERLVPTVQQAYVSYDVTGYQDLSSNGVWEESTDYGPIWYPTTVDADWAPYRYGYWTSVRPWGWTWIDRAPWGFAPFHYGRWCQIDGRWGWIPGNRHEPHVYAPALVAFVGGGPGEHMDGGVGWVPLGPYEVFHPYYPHTDTYVLNVNRANFHDEHDFRERESHWHGPDAAVNNLANHAAVTQVGAAAFTGGKPVHQNLTPQPIGPNRGPARVVSDFGHLPHPGPQPQQSQPQQSRPAAMPLQQQERPERPERPQPIQQPAPQPMQQYHPPPQYHPQPQQQPQQQRAQPEPQSSGHRDGKDKRDPH